MIEERGIERVFAGKPSVAHLLSFIIRTGNTFLGSLLWVRLWIRLGRLQAATRHADGCGMKAHPRHCRIDFAWHRNADCR